MKVNSQPLPVPPSRLLSPFFSFRTGLILWLLWHCLGWSGTAAETAAPAVSVINVLMLYTPQARDAAGGSPAILRQINTALFEANTVFQNSRVNARLRLALAARIDYHESGSVSNDLARLRNPKDPAFALAHRLRNQYAADLVCLITETGKDWDFYGLQGPSADNAFSILRRPFLTGKYYLPVTLSFNFGCQLERTYADSLAAFSYGYGCTFWADGRSYSTVEAFTGERLPFFSNPDIVFRGEPAGIPAGQSGAADNARVLNQTAPIVAAFRGDAAPTRPPTVAINQPASGAKFPVGTSIRFSAAAADPDGKVRSVNYYAGTNWLASAASPPFVAFWRRAPLGQCSIVAVATDSQGATTVSDPVPITIVPANDNFANRTQLTGNRIALHPSNAFATREPNEPNHADLPGDHSLWWTWTAPTNGVVWLDTLGTEFDHRLAVYTGTSLQALSPVTAYDGFNVLPVHFNVTGNSPYQIAFDSLGSDAGDFTLNLRFTPAPTNDAFAHRTRLQGAHLSLRSDNSSASHEPDEPDHAKTPGRASLWWSWTAPAAGTLSLSLPQADFQSPLWGVYTGTALTNLVECEAAASPGSFLVHRGVNYQIALDVPADSLDDLGPFTLNLDFAPAPPNDNFANRTRILTNHLTLRGSAAQATLEPGDPSPCPSVWWSWTAPASGRVSLQSADGAPLWLGLYAGDSLGNLALLADSTTSLNFEVTAGTTYAIAAGGLDEVILEFDFSSVQLTSPTPGASFTVGSDIPLTAMTTTNDGPLRKLEFFVDDLSLAALTQPPYRWVWHQAPQGNHQLQAVATDTRGLTHSSLPVVIRVRPVNDDFAGSTVVTGTSVLLTNSTAGASRELGEPANDPNAGSDSIWWSWTAPASGQATLSLTSGGGGLVGRFDVYTGHSLSQLTLVASGRGEDSFPVVQDTTYSIRAHSWSGPVVLRLSLSTLQLTTPTNGQQFVDGSDLELQVASTPIDGNLRQVEFRANGASLGVATQPPFSARWPHVPAGQFTLVAVATDDQGITRSSPPVSIVVVPTNDAFANRPALSGDQFSITGSTAAAGIEPGEPDYGGGHTHASVWYSWTAPWTGPFTLEATGDGYVPGIRVFTGTALGALTPVVNTHADRLSFPAQAGTLYQIEVDADTTMFGSGRPFTLTLRASPLNDAFDQRLAITNLASPITANNLYATAEPGEPGLLLPTGHSLWWSWVAPQSGRLIARGSATEPYPVLRLFAGSSVTNLLPIPRLDGSDYSGVARVEFMVTGGTECILEVDRLWQTDGAVAFTLDFTPMAPNNDFANRQVLVGPEVSVAGDNSCATRQLGEPQIPGTGAGRSVWYSWSAPAAGWLTVSLVSTGAPPVGALFRGTSVADLTLLASTGPTATQLSFQVHQGQTYALGIDGGAGPFTLNLNLAPGPENDDFAQRTRLAGFQATATGSTRGASYEPGEPLPGWGALGSVWYSWTAPVAGRVRVGCPSPMLYVFSGTTLSSLRWVATGSEGEAEFEAAAGTEYQIQVSNRSGSGVPDDFALTLASADLAIAYPTPGTVLPGPASLTLLASALDPASEVQSVEFFAGSNSLGMASRSPFALTWTNVPPGRYWLRALGTKASGATTLSAGVELRVAPENDAFASPIVLTGTNVTFTGDNHGASAEPGEPGGATAQTLWWAWTAPADGRVTITNGLLNLVAGATAPRAQRQPPARTSLDSVIIIIVPPPPPVENDFPFVEVFTGDSLANLTWCTNNMTRDGWSGERRLSAFTFPVRQGVTYRICLGSSYSIGAASLNLTFVPSVPPANDAFARRLQLSGFSLSVSGTTIGASREWGEPTRNLDPDARTVWYSWTAPVSGTVQLQSWPQNVYPRPFLSLFAGGALSTLIPVSSGDGGIEFYALAGTTYQIQVTGSAGWEGDFGFSLQAPPPPPTLDPDHTVRLPDRSYRVRVTGLVGQSFVVQASTNQRDWQTLRTDTLQREYLEFIDAGAAHLPQRFYRVLPLEAQFDTRPFSLTATRLASGAGLSLRLTGDTGQPFRLLTSTNLVDWNELTSGVLSDAAFIRTDPTTSDARFYRALKQ